MVPGVAYGHGLDPRPLVVDEKTLHDVRRHQRGSNVLLDLKVDGESPGNLAAIIKTMQTDPISDEVLAVDFQWVSLTEHVTVSVSVHLAGTAPGAVQGGALDQSLHEVEVTCLPLQIPEALILDISGMEIHDTLHVSDLVAPEGVEILTALDEPVVTVRQSVSAAALAPEPAEGEEAAEAEEGEEAGESAGDAEE
jgi:large subunit ribosomal protein L25